MMSVFVVLLWHNYSACCAIAVFEDKAAAIEFVANHKEKGACEIEEVPFNPAVPDDPGELRYLKLAKENPKD